MGALFAILFIVAAWDVARSAVRHASSDYQRSRDASVGRAARNRAPKPLTSAGRRAAVRRHAAGYWAGEVLHGFPVARTGLHAGWLAHRTARVGRQADREEARTQHAETQASFIRGLREHRRRQAEAQRAIEEALAAQRFIDEAPERAPRRPREAVREATGAAVLPFARRDPAAPPLPSDEVDSRRAEPPRRPNGPVAGDLDREQSTQQLDRQAHPPGPQTRPSAGSANGTGLPPGTEAPATTSSESEIRQRGPVPQKAPGGTPADHRPEGACNCGLPACRSGWPDPAVTDSASLPPPAEGIPASDVAGAEARSHAGKPAVSTQPVTAMTAQQDGPAAPASSGQQAGGSDSNPANGGNGMGMPTGELAGDSPYRSALTAMDGYDQVAQQHEQAAETLEAQLTLHGFDRDQGLMEHIRALRETAGQIRAHTAGARQVLVDHHAVGDEYHTSGVDAEASAFRH